MSDYIKRNKHIAVAVQEKAKPGNVICGDAHIVTHGDGYTVCAVVDGLGSGEGASEAANAAIAVVKSQHDQSVETIVTACNEAMRQKRGAVITVLKVLYDKKIIEYCNVGNIGFVMCTETGEVVRPLPNRGYLTGGLQKIESKSFQYETNSVFSLYSDGISIPPAKELLLKIASGEVSMDKLFPTLQYEEDDATVLVGILM